MLNPIHLRTLCVVVNTGSFALAAQELGYTGSAVSQQVSALERSLGLALFERSVRSIRPTSAALAIAARSLGVLTALDHLEKEANGFARGSKGVLRVGSFPTFSAGILPRAVKQFRELRPLTEVWLEEDEPSVMIPRLVSGDLDVAVVYEYSGVPQEITSTVTRTPLVVEDLLLLQSGTDPVRELVDLRTSTFVATKKDTAGAGCLEKLCSQVGFSPYIALRSNDYDVVQSFVAEGQGVAVVPALAYSPRSNVVATSVGAGAGVNRTVFALHRPQSYQPLREPFLAELRDAVDDFTSEWIRRP
jgi:DNA-binding transcriptional LysR family regulator